MFNWFSFISYALITTFTPGPNNIMSMSTASRLGFKKSLPFSLGVLAGTLVIFILSALLCSVLSEYVPAIQTPMKFVGAAYMLYLAWHIYKSAGVIDENYTHRGFGSGALLQFINVKVLIYAIVSMEAYILPYFGSRPAVVVCFAIALSVVGFASTVCWALFGSAFRKIFSEHTRVINICMAVMLAYCAVSLFIE